MLIQHILTEEIFSQVFDDSNFHRQNNVAKELYALENTFFTGKVKHDTLAGLRPYYAAIKSAAALVTGHHEKQNFLKIIYENFYKIYDKKKADRLGVVYTPNEIVRFMIESADCLCQKHFGKALIDKNVEILDPAAGTGTFITELIEHFRGQSQKLRYKYLEELHANEVAILPYYVANLNIEATYAAINGFEEYPNLCFVDTLDNTAALKAQKGQQVGDLFGAVSEENVARIKRQNAKKISVIIGNPPYNANQMNENENNKNREYPEIDRRIKDTYIADSTAQKTKLYDMYARFFRWASDRVDANGIVAFVSNSSFIDSRTYDGFRKLVAEEFNEIWIIDLKGNARTSGERRRREGGNVFDDQIRVGIAVYFCVKKKGTHGCHIRYQSIRDYAKSDEKREFLHAPISARKFEDVRPDKDHNWINLTDNDFGTFIPIASKETKAAKTKGQERAIFKLMSNGIVSARDEWTTGFSDVEVAKKVAAFCALYTSEQVRWKNSAEHRQAERKKAKAAKTQAKKETLRNFVSRKIKWTEELESHLDRGDPLTFKESELGVGADRPFIAVPTYYARIITHRVYQQDQIFPIGKRWDNRAIGFSGLASLKPFQCLAVDRVPSFDLLEKTQFVPIYRYEKGSRLENITDWALEQFRARYEKDKMPKRPVTKDAIFHYVYGILHDPVYRENYALNLKRKFPRIPYYPDFWKWAEWGEKLMALHIGYETIEPWPLERIDAPQEKSRKHGLAPKALLRANKDSGNIQIDSETQLAGVPPEAWTYRLGNRSALEWILDQYKEKTPKDPTMSYH